MFEKAYDYITKGAILRSRDKCHEGKTKTPSIFSTYRTTTRRKQPSEKNYNKENTPTLNPKEIMTSLKSFYGDLYHEKIGMPTAEIKHTFLQNDDIP